DGGFGDGGVFQETLLDFGWGDPDAAGFEHVVVAAETGVGVVVVADVGVAGAEPFAEEGAAGCLGAAPVAGGDGWAAEVELAGGAGGGDHGAACVADLH